MPTDPATTSSPAPPDTPPTPMRPLVPSSSASAPSPAPTPRAELAAAMPTSSPGTSEAREAASTVVVATIADAPPRGGVQALLSSPRFERLWAFIQRALPIASLLFSIVSAIWMKRTPERAPTILAIAVVGWGLVAVALMVVNRLAQVAAERGHAESDLPLSHKVGQFVALLVSQSMMQQALCFPLPFFAAAASPVLAHVPFALTYIAVLVIAGWDPFYERAARFAPLLLFLQAFAALVALATVLPVLGLQNTAAVVVTGVVVGLGVPVGLAVHGFRSRRALGVGVGIAVMVAILVMLGAPFLPPAPLALSSGAMATGVRDREPIGVDDTFPAGASTLWCHTAIRAPLGLRDTLRHVWTRDGAFVQEVKLTVAGGRETGFRTWSRLSHVTPGRYRCRVETTLGQIVGEVRARVGE